MKTAVIYARYSSDNQTEQSIEGQLRVCQEYAEKNGILILNTYIDRAMTGTNDNRPAFQQMIKDSKDRKWNFVLVYKLDRFSRDKYATTIYKKRLKDNSVKLLSAMENIPDSPEGVLMESVLEGLNQYYSMELAQKVKRGLNESRIKGHFTGGTLIYGYYLDNLKIVINEEQAEVVRYIYEQYAIGVSVKDIIANLTARGILNKGKPFARNTIYNILKNEKYVGIYRHNNEVFTNIYPQIVPTETFEKVRAKVNSNKYGKQSNETVYLLRNKVKCGYCGSSVTAESGTSKTGVKKRYYKCIGRKHGNGCTKSMVRKEFLEKFVLEQIVSILKNKDKMNDIISGLIIEQERRTIENTTLNLLMKERNQTENALNNVMRAIERGIMNNTTSKRMKELEELLDELDKKIIFEKCKTVCKISEKEMREFYEQALLSEPKLLISYLVKEIRLYDDKIEIEFNSPLQSSPDNSRGFLLYTGFKKLPYSMERNIQVELKTLRVEIYVK